MDNKLKKFLLAMVLITILAIGGAFPLMVTLKKFDATEFQMLLASLFLVALFLERVVEVFVTTWRDPEVDLIRSQKLIVQKQIECLQAAIQKAEAEIAQLKQVGQDSQAQEGAYKELIGKVETKKNDIYNIEKEEIEYTSGTKRFALYFALGAGMAISAVGVRILGTLVDLGAGMSGQQQMAFRLIDIAFTGGLLAGGSEAFHRLAALYNTFLDATIKKANV